MIKISKENISYDIPKYVFAHNLEHTRSCVYQGLSAQMLRNRKFAGKCGRTGVAQDWERIGSDFDYFYIDRADTYTRHDSGEKERYMNEKNSQKFQNLSGQKCGLRQAGVALVRGRSYELRFVVKSDRDIRVLICIATAAGSVNIAFLESFVSESREWQTYKMNFTSRYTGDDFVYEIYTEEVGELSIGALSFMPGDHFYEMRRDVIEELRNIGTTMLRWPGGNFAGEYRWKDGLMESDLRSPLCSYIPIETQPYMSGFDNHEIGINQFIELCREINAEPFVTFNIFWDSEEDCLAFYEYCNGESDSAWGAVRAQHGYTDAFGIDYWSLGNEMGYGHMEGLNTIDAYTDKALAVSKLLKEKAPEIKLVCSGPYPNDQWVKGSLSRLAGPEVYVSYHTYRPMKLPSAVKYTNEKEVREALEMMTSAPYAAMRDILRLRRSIDTELGDNDVRISFDEWNTWYAWYRSPAPGEGLYAAVMLNNICRMSQLYNMPICCYFQPVNEGAINVMKDKSELTNIGIVFEMYRQHQDGKIIDIDGFCVGNLDSAEVAIEKIEKGDIDILASYNEADKRITVTAVNKKSIDYELDFIFDGYKIKEVHEAMELTSDAMLPGHRLTRLELDKSAKGIMLRRYSIMMLTVYTE